MHSVADDRVLDARDWPGIGGGHGRPRRGAGGEAQNDESGKPQRIARHMAGFFDSTDDCHAETAGSSRGRRPGAASRRSARVGGLGRLLRRGILAARLAGRPGPSGPGEGRRPQDLIRRDRRKAKRRNAVVTTAVTVGAPARALAATLLHRWRSPAGSGEAVCALTPPNLGGAPLPAREAKSRDGDADQSERCGLRDRTRFEPQHVCFRRGRRPHRRTGARPDAPAVPGGHRNPGRGSEDEGLRDDAGLRTGRIPRRKRGTASCATAFLPVPRTEDRLRQADEYNPLRRGVGTLAGVAGSPGVHSRRVQAGRRRRARPIMPATRSESVAGSGTATASIGSTVNDTV